MGGDDDTPWERQKRELESYNLFYSAYTGRADEDSLSDNGYVVVSRFPEIEYRGGAARPDFILYDESTFLQVEVKTGDNIEKRDIKQMERCEEVTIEAAEEYLGDAKVEERFGYGTTVDTVEGCVIYQGMDEGFVEECKDSANCRESLSELKEVAPILTQGFGSTLRLLEGRFSVHSLNIIFEEGIELPNNPKKEVFLTDGVEVESLVVAICLIWGKQARSEEVTVDPQEVISRFAPRRNVRNTEVSEAFGFLEKRGICSKERVEAGDEMATRYVFSPADMGTILNIERIIAEMGSIGGDQSGLSDFE